MQVSLLRFLDRGEYRPVGSTRTLQANVRVVGATNQDIQELVHQGRFRDDLLYRINTVTLRVPPLRERREDIRLLVNYFLKKFSAPPQAPRSISADVVAALERHHWPGNVRELENVIRRALVVAKGEAILLPDLPAEVIGSGPAGAGLAATAPGASSAVTRPADGSSNADIASLARALFQWARQERTLQVIPAVERELIIQALLETEGNQVQAAKLLGITRATLRKRVEKFHIKQELAIK